MLHVDDRDAVEHQRRRPARVLRLTVLLGTVLGTSMGATDAAAQGRERVPSPAVPSAPSPVPGTAGALHPPLFGEQDTAVTWACYSLLA